MEKLHHNGVLVPPRYEGKSLTVKVKGDTITLTTEQEEMAVAWAKKVGTPYAEDSVFAKNFHKDFSKKLGFKVKPGDVDYSEIIALVQKEREYKANLPREEKKRLAAQRKVVREANKERYGYMVCPCRLASGDREGDKDIICPCVYREPDVEEYGSCYCNLYVSQEWNQGKIPHAYVPERRPPEKMGF